MAKVQFISYTPNQILLFPRRIDEDIADDDPVCVVDAVVDSLGMGCIHRPRKPDIRLIRLVCRNRPDFITVNRFRNRVKDGINNNFTRHKPDPCRSGNFPHIAAADCLISPAGRRKGRREFFSLLRRRVFRLCGRNPNFAPARPNYPKKQSDVVAMCWNTVGGIV